MIYSYNMLASMEIKKVIYQCLIDKSLEERRNNILGNIEPLIKDLRPSIKRKVMKVYTRDLNYGCSMITILKDIVINIPLL